MNTFDTIDECQRDLIRMRFCDEHELEARRTLRPSLFDDRLSRELAILRLSSRLRSIGGQRK